MRQSPSSATKKQVASSFSRHIKTTIRDIPMEIRRYGDMRVLSMNYSKNTLSEREYYESKLKRISLGSMAQF